MDSKRTMYTHCTLALRTNTREKQGMRCKDLSWLVRFQGLRSVVTWRHCFEAFGRTEQRTVVEGRTRTHSCSRTTACYPRVQGVCYRF